MYIICTYCGLVSLFYVVRNFRTLQVNPEDHLSAHFMEVIESFMYRPTFYISSLILRESTPWGEDSTWNNSFS